MASEWRLSLLSSVKIKEGGIIKIKIKIKIKTKLK
jgi:hypothetical protein